APGAGFVAGEGCSGPFRELQVPVGMPASNGGLFSARCQLLQRELANDLEHRIARLWGFDLRRASFELAVAPKQALVEQRAEAGDDGEHGRSARAISGSR